MSKLCYSEMVRLAFGDLVEFFDDDDTNNETTAKSSETRPQASRQAQSSVAKLQQRPRRMKGASAPRMGAPAHSAA